MNSISAAHPTLPLPSYVRVTNLANGRSIIVRVNDRGPYTGGRLIDLSVRTAQLLGFHGQGVARVKVEYVGRAPLAGSDDRKLMATLREGNPAMAPIQVAAGRPFAPAYFDGRPVAKYRRRKFRRRPTVRSGWARGLARCLALSQRRPTSPPLPARALPAT